MSLSQEINAFTECSICTETYNDPRVLPCLHTFCLKCLESYGQSRKREGNLNCPICRANFEIQSKTFSDLPFNFFIQKLIEVNDIARKPSSNACDACDEQSISAACVYCFDCRQSLCESCCQVHNKLRYNRTHQVAEFGKKQAEQLLKAKPTFCELHPDEMVKLFCSDCDSTICMICYAEKHSSHKWSYTAEAGNTFLEELGTDTSKVSQHINVCLLETEKLRNKRTEYLQHVSEKDSLVIGMVKQLHGLVDTYGKQISSELKSLKEMKMKEFETEENEIRDRRVMLESFKRYSEEVMAKATPADVTRLAAMLKRRATELHAMRLDNDLCSFDIEITSSNMNHLLNEKIRNPVIDVVVRKNRRDQVNAFRTDYTVISQTSSNPKVVCDMSAIGPELYLLMKGSRAGERKIIGAQVIQMSLQKNYKVYDCNYHHRSRSSRSLDTYTSCDSVAVLLKLLASHSSTGKIIQLGLEVSSLNLTASEDNFNTTAVFQLQDWHGLQTVNVNPTILIRAPTKLNSVQVYGIKFSPRICLDRSAVKIDLTVQGSASLITKQDTYQAEQMVDLVSDTCQVAVNQQPSLEVYALDSLCNCELRQIITDATVLKVQLPNNFIKKDGSSVSRAGLIPYDSIAILIQMYCRFSSKPTNTSLSETEVKLSSVGLSQSDGGNFVSDATLRCRGPYHLKQLSRCSYKITLKATKTLIKSDFYGIDLEVRTETTHENTVKVEVSVVNLNTVNGNYQTEVMVPIPTNIQLEHRTLRRTINLPSAINPTFMVSCSYHICLYVGDRQSSSIYRAEPNGKLDIWKLDEVPTGMSVTLDHTLLVTLSKSSKLKEYNTNGIALREIQLTGLENPIHSTKLPNNQFFVISQKKAKNFICVVHVSSENAVASTKEMILFADEGTTFTDLKTTDAETSASAAEVVQESGGKASAKVSGGSTCKATVIELNESIHAVVDRFGYVFILTKNDAKVHLLNPQLNYLRELVSLKKHGMTSPSKLYFHDESGILYASSETDEESVLGFQVTEGKIDPSVWKKDEGL